LGTQDKNGQYRDTGNIGYTRQEWTIQRHWQHWVHKIQDKDKQNKQNKTQHTKLDEQHRPHKRLQGEPRYSR
jgi:hypothetical protein